MQFILAAMTRVVFVIPSDVSEQPTPPYQPGTALPTMTTRLAELYKKFNP